MNRKEFQQQVLRQDKVWDVIIIGGGATGLGVAVDAASRGFTVALFEQDDFTKSTSSKSTKLVHGGVRYLAEGDVMLVLEALRERGLLLKNAPHLTRNQPFMIPCYRWWEGPFYAIGLTLYDLMAGRLSLGRSRYKKKSTVIKTMPTLKQQGLRGGVLYHDGQFDDSRLAINLAQTAVEQGAAVLNYIQVTGLLKKDGKVSGVTIQDVETGKFNQIWERSVINATGVFVDSILQMDKPTGVYLVRPSQGVHIVLDRSFLESDYAIMIPKTDDGRVLFAVPWHNEVVIGTTDTLVDHASLDPVALESEIEFILATAGRYLSKPPKRSDVLSVFAGLRPLAAPKKEGGGTKEISRNHKIWVSNSSLVTITGGKWTTYRKMAEDTVDKVIKLGLLDQRKCVTETLKIHGHRENPNFNNYLYPYGADEPDLRQLIGSTPEMNEKIHPKYEFRVGQIVWAVHNEMARTVEDILSRRIRLTFLDARAAIEAAPRVASVLATELGHNETWTKEQVKAYTKIAETYLLR